MDKQLRTCENNGLRLRLKNETSLGHDRVDADFASLPMDTKQGFATFLTAHHLAWSLLGTTWEQFVQYELGLRPPPYLSLLRDDLAEVLGDRDLPQPLEAALPDCHAGIVYVLAGSRMGMAVIRRRPNWARESQRGQRFVEDGSGPTVFRAMVGYLDESTQGRVDAPAAIEAAKWTFSLFGRAMNQARSLA